MITPLRPDLPVAAPRGGLAAEMFRWLNNVRTALLGPFVGVQAVETLTIPDGEYGVHAKRLTVSGKSRIALAGSARLVIHG